MSDHLYEDPTGPDPVLRVTSDNLQTGATEEWEIPVGSFLVIAPESDIEGPVRGSDGRYVVTITPRPAPEPPAPPIPTKRKRAWWK